MKKKAALLLALVCLGSTIFSEGNFGTKVEVGYPMYTGIEVDLAGAKQDFSYNYNAGAFFEFIINDYFGIQLEGGYSMKTIDYESFSPDRWRMLYFPLFAKGKIPTDFAEYYFMAGPTMHVILEEPYNDDPYNMFLFGYSFESGVSFPVFPGGDSLVIGFHYNSHFNKPYSGLELDILDLDLVLAFSTNTSDLAVRIEEYNASLKK